MWPFIKPIRLIRYLFVCRINRSLIKTTDPLTTELSWALGYIIANRLPSAEAKPWREALDTLEAYQKESAKAKKILPPTPAITWPLEAVCRPYPHKFSYGPGEYFLWELKLLGSSADHNLFLELILPAVEALSCTSDRHLYHQNGLWGRFDIHAVYAARGLTWEPVVDQGRLDLNYRPASNQWADGLDFGLIDRQPLDTIMWTAAFQFEDPASYLQEKGRKNHVTIDDVPTLTDILEALLARVVQILPEAGQTPEGVWDICGPEEETRFEECLALAKRIRREYYRLYPAPKHIPGMWWGLLRFNPLPLLVIPYLELASILHIGHHTYFGCGTFGLQKDSKKNIES